MKKISDATNTISKILIISAHPPIDSELATSWINMGIHVNVISKSVKWNDQFQSLNPLAEINLPVEQPDLIVVGHPIDSIYAILMKFQKRWFKVKIVMIHWWFPKRLPVYYFVKNISVCLYGRKYLNKILGISSNVAYCPVDTIHFRKKNEIKNEKRIITIGNKFKERKIMGYDHLINIIENVHSKEPDTDVVIIGKNKKEDFPKYVSVINCNKEEMVDEINKASVVFFTTTQNLIMNSLQIAMACERRVVAFDLEPFREVIRNEVSGFLIPNFDDTKFSEILLRTLKISNNEMEKLARKSIIEKCERSYVSSKIIEYSMQE